MRDTISYTPILTQGSIFNNAVSQDYLDCFGMIISARCDIAHSKIDKYCYVPVIKVPAWIKYDGYQIAKNTTENQYLETIRTKLRNIGKSDDIVNYISIETILEKFLKEDPKCSEKIHNLINLRKHKRYEDSTTELIDINKNINRTLKDIISYKVSGYYFFEGIESQKDHCIALLREIHYLPREYAIKLKKGFTPTFKEKNENIYFNDRIETYILGVLNSPYIEHFMQQFSLLYTRIGVDDFNDIETVLEGAGLCQK